MLTLSRMLATLFLIGSVGVVHATPIVFTQTHYSSFAQSVAGGTSDGPFSDITASMLPIGSTASALSADGDNASAVALADTFFLVTTAEAAPQPGAAAATAVGTFSGMFDALPGVLTLSFFLDNFNDSLADGLASGTLAATLEVGGITLYNDILTASSLFDGSFNLASGGAGLLDLTLISSANAAPGDYAFNLASVSFALDAQPVPEPASWVLMLAGLAGLGVARRRGI